jgi:hypothetical protein
MEGYDGQPLLLNLGHVLVVDNFYTCIYLFFELSLKSTEAIGTVRSNRAGLPKAILKKEWKPTQKGSRIVKYCYRFQIMNWMDSKPVRILSSIGSCRPEDDQNNKPETINLYNQFMPGVDKADQMKFGRKIYRRRVKKYYKTLFYHIFDQVLINSFIYYNEIPGIKQLSHRDFRISLVEEIFRDQDCSVNCLPIGRRRDTNVIFHCPEWTEQRKVCVVCETNNIRTHIICQDCSGIGLCLNKDRNCFKKFHSDLFNGTIKRRYRHSTVDD